MENYIVFTEKLLNQNLCNFSSSTAKKVSVFAAPYFPAFGLNTERHEVSPCIQSECEYYIIGLSGSLSISHPKKLKNPQEKDSLYFWKWNFLAQMLKKNSYIFSKESFSHILLKESCSYISGYGTSYLKY